VISLLLLIVCPASVGLLVIAPRLVPLFLAAQWDAAVPITQTFALLIVPRAVSAIQSVVLRSLGQSASVLWFRIVQSVAYALLL
jgi:O-antigen/teichoic acid export membrane protein